MKISQVSVFLGNKEGRLLSVCSLLGKDGINIKTLTVAESNDFGILRMIVDKPEQAVQALKASGYAADITDIVAVEVADKPGGLAAVLKVLSDANLNVEYMYGFMEKSNENALMVFRFDDTQKAIDVLKKNGVAVVGKSGIKGF